MPHPVTILYHADCLDGFGAAYAAWCRYGGAANYRPMHHGTPLDIEDMAGHEVVILDFSYPPALIERMAGIARSVTLIDHHVSALKEWAGRTQVVGNVHTFTHPHLPLTVRFDMTKSGARLAWEHFHPESAIPLAIQHIEDQDLWRFSLEGTRPFCRALRLMPFDLETWHCLISESSETSSPRYIETLNQGTAIETFFQREVERLAQSPLRMPARLRGEPVDALQASRHGREFISHEDLAWLAVGGLAINANALFASELGNLLAEQSASFGMVWQLSGDGEVKISLRSQSGRPDVSVIAARYGGGGHASAAGFRLPARQFFSEVLGCAAPNTL